MSEVCYAVGVVPLRPVVFWDYDLQQLPNDKTFLQNRNYEIYKTKHGYHFLIQVHDWDEAQDLLYRLKDAWKTQSIMSCRKQRIRVSPKWAASDGHEVSPAPILLLKSDHVAPLRVGKLEFYRTYDEGLNAGVSFVD